MIDKSNYDELTAATKIVADKFLDRLFGKGDLRGAYDEFVTPNFIQHNPKIADGIEGHKAYFNDQEKQKSELSSAVNVINMIIVDGDKFAVHHYTFANTEDVGRVSVDMWRVEHGKIVEHWDVTQAIPAEMAHSNGMAGGFGDDYEAASALVNTVNAPTCGLPKQEYNREASLQIVDSYAAAMRSGGDIVNIINTWLTSDYKQHSPYMEDGRAGAIKLLKAIYGQEKTALPDEKGFRLMAQGDYTNSIKFVI